MRNRRWMVFSDLDGTLLDHATYSWEGAQEALSAIRSQRIPLILASSKTAAEVAVLRRAMGFEHCPAIVENGAGLLPAGETEVGNKATHCELLKAIRQMPTAVRAAFTGFSDWSPKQLAEIAGLTIEQALLAKQRDFTEPGMFSGDEALRHELTRWADTYHVVLTQGGRFLSLSFGGNKADRLREIRDEYAAEVDGPVVTVALGDAPNDSEMLEAADVGIIIPNPSHRGIPPLTGEAEGRIRREVLPGPSGWCRGLLQILDRRDM